jgi:hypothetical protein
MSTPIDNSTFYIDSDTRSVEQRARDLLAGHSHFHGRASTFEFQCSESILVVRGVVPTFYLKQLLQTVLKEIQGVGGIDNQVIVISSEGISSVR